MIKKNSHWFLLLPMLLIMVIFVAYPIIRTLFYSFYELKLTHPGNIHWIGWENYREVLRSAEFYHAFKNSAVVLVYVMVLGLVASIATALMLNRHGRLSSLLTAIAIIPWALPPIVNGIIWKFIFYPGFGLVNKICVGLGLLDKPYAWTGQLHSLLFIAAIVVVWRIVPFCALLILANLQTIPHELYEAARVDGSSAFQELRLVTLPMILPSLAIVMIQLTMGGLNVFDEIVALAGYRFESQTLLVYNYMNTFSFLNFGFGSAISYIVTLLSGIIGYSYIRAMAKEVA